MPLADIVNVSITTNTANPSLPGFGEPLIAAYTTVFSSRTMEFGSLSGIVQAGFPTSDPFYLAAAAVFSQNPRVPFLKCGRRATPWAQVLNVTCLSTSATDTYAFKAAGHSVSVASTGVPATDVATINTAITALSIAHLTATHSGAVLTLTMAAGYMIDILPDLVHTSLADVTADPGSTTLTADLAAILAADNNWYGLLLASNSPAEIAEAAAWAESNAPKIFIANCSDTAIGDPSSTTDIAYLLKQSSYARTGLLFSPTQLLCYSGAAWMGNRFPASPGSDTWAYKTLAGVPVDNLNPNQSHAVTAKNANVYTSVAGLNITQFGISPAGEYIDIVRFVDWLTQQMQLQVFGLLANNAKLPYTDAGIDAIRSTMIGVLAQGVQVGGLAANPAPVVNLPTAAQAGTPARISRNLPNVTFTAQLAGAIHTLTITGTLTP